MNIAVIICELNPMHRGHFYLIEEVKKKNIDIVVGIMSGNFVQRGDLSIVNKFTKARLALNLGFDLILELPSYSSLKSAEFFAKDAVQIASKIGANYLAFGSETGEELLDFFRIIENNKSFIDIKLREYLKLNYSYSKALRLATSELIPNFKIFSNDSLGLEYLKAIDKTRIKPIIIKRVGQDYLDEKKDEFFPSASSIRSSIFKNDKNISSFDDPFVKEAILNLDLKSLSNSNEKIYELLKYKILVENNEVSNIIFYENGLENLFRNNFDKKNYNLFLDSISSKRYKKSRLKRFILNYILENNSYDMDLYIRPLSFNDKGRDVLKNINNKEKIISKLADSQKSKEIEFETRATALYNILTNSNINEYKISPYYNKSL